MYKVSSGKVKEQKLSVKVKEQTTQRQGKGTNCSVERYRNKLFSDNYNYKYSLGTIYFSGEVK